MAGQIEGSRTEWRSGAVGLLVLLLVCSSAAATLALSSAALNWPHCPGAGITRGYVIPALLGALAMVIMLSMWTAIRYLPRWPDFSPGARVGWIGWSFAFVFGAMPATFLTIALSAPWDAAQEAVELRCGFSTWSLLAHASLVPLPFLALAFLMALNGPRQRSPRIWRIVVPVSVAVAGWFGYVLWALVENPPA